MLTELLILEAKLILTDNTDLTEYKKILKKIRTINFNKIIYDALMLSLGAYQLSDNIKPEVYKKE
jgi:hypothetical protein